MLDVEVIESAEASAAALDPVRARLLGELAVPASAAGLAARVGIARQKVNYHLKALEAHGLVRLSEERRHGGITERVLQASAASYVVSPAAVSASAADPDANADHLSAGYLVALAGRLVREVGALARRAGESGQRLPTLTIDTQIGFRSAADRAAFADDLTAAVLDLAARYHHDDGRPHRLVIAAHPLPGGERMITTPNVPYRLEFSVEVPGTPEQVWQAIATAKGMSAWFLPTEMEEREGGSVHFTMGPTMGSDGQVTGWDPPRRLVYEEDWAALMGKDADALSPLTSEFLVEAQSGGTCVVRVTSSGFGTGAAWESEFWDDLAPNWMPFFDNLRLYLSHFPGQESTQMEATVSHPGDADALWSTLHDALALGEEGATVEVRGTTGTVERSGERQTLVRLTAPVPGMLSVFVFDEGDSKATVGVRAYLFSADAADYVRREEPAWQAWLQGLSVPV